MAKSFLPSRPNPALHFTAYSRQQFLRLPAAASDPSEKASLLAARGQVVRRRGQLLITLDNGKVVRLTNHDGDNPDTYAQYRFYGRIPALQSWLVEVTGWENGHTLLIEQTTGKQTRLWSAPVLAPDQLHFVTHKSGFIFDDDNGLQYWAIRGHAPVKLWEYQLESWGPEEVRWINNTSIAIRQQRADDQPTAPRRYVSVRLTP
ncbi:hypothetical protein [Hymenobacter persicinus]|uniref:S9 family peptidase n=1 Tax=Hymenobacter persicinus TaxID=2025506 RepID=A0A4Q5LHS7_9BACT|nr:hypothetical protein [Hymenobacter persicinus]RYU83842.1 hypothetical protein EWM57_02560 [Hymenobacter persicinus]